MPSPFIKMFMVERKPGEPTTAIVTTQTIGEPTPRKDERPGADAWLTTLENAGKLGVNLAA